MGSHLMMGLESQVAEAAMEVEYSYFLLLTQEQISAISKEFSEANRFVFSESKLGFNKDTGMSGRIRHYDHGKGSEFELTTKTRGNDTKSKMESNIVLDQMNYNMLLDCCAESTLIRTRIEIPVTRADGSTVARGDGVLKWELDLYIDGREVDDENPSPIHPWVKLEMEVDKATLDDVIKYIPFEYTQLIQADTTDRHERELIEDLFNNGYNVKGRIKMESTESISTFS